MIPDRSLAGTSMNELVNLGESDEAPRWIGVRRHQIALLLVGTALMADGILRVGATWLELVAGLTCVAMTIPGFDGLTTGEWFTVGARYLIRHRFSIVGIERRKHEILSRGRGTERTHLFTLVHRGRMDLSGADVTLNAALISLLDGRATAPGRHHVSVHLQRRNDIATTVLSLPLEVSPPPGWTATPLEVLPGTRVETDPQWHLERWRYVRTANSVIAVMRVSAYTSTGSSMLDGLQQSAAWSEMSIHIEVIGGAVAHRVVARAVHASRSDAAATTSVGFRRTARSSRRLERMRQREEMVAQGRALLRLGVYVVAVATTVAELERVLDSLKNDAQAGGLRCQRGGGRQMEWLSNQLPGGVGW